MASRCSGGTTKGDLGLVGAVGKHGHVHVRTVVEAHRRGSCSGDVRGVEVYELGLKHLWNTGKMWQGRGRTETRWLVLATVSSESGELQSWRW